MDGCEEGTAVGSPVGWEEGVDEGGVLVDLRRVAGGWRYYTREEYAAVVERFVMDGQQARLTQAALETLSVVAYKEPVSRARVSAIRQVVESRKAAVEQLRRLGFGVSAIVLLIALAVDRASGRIP